MIVLLYAYHHMWLAALLDMLDLVQWQTCHPPLGIEAQGSFWVVWGKILLTLCDVQAKLHDDSSEKNFPISYWLGAISLPNFKFLAHLETYLNDTFMDGSTDESFMKSGDDLNVQSSNNTKVLTLASKNEICFTLSFLDECDKMKILMHLHSFTYDYHLRSIHAYVSGRQAFLKQGYHLSRFLDDFLKYYSKAPNFARNLVYADTVSIGNLTTHARQLFNYLLSHEKVYQMEVFRMAPVSHDNDTAKDNEYVLVQLDSTPHMTYHDINDMKHTDDFDVTLIVSHDVDSLEDGGDKHDQNVLHLKYYIILTSRSIV
uniref:Uncharacterized protein n=1 Tax=Timema cristinae TaxID=61476 RepID=A0A7R9D7R7_TIMCR|nr:unnamed protein product [Timema cristinae]